MHGSRIVELSVPCHGPSGEWFLCLLGCLPCLRHFICWHKSLFPISRVSIVEIGPLHCVGILSGSCQVNLFAHHGDCPGEREPVRWFIFQIVVVWGLSLPWWLVTRSRKIRYTCRVSTLENALSSFWFEPTCGVRMCYVLVVSMTACQSHTSTYGVQSTLYREARPKTVL